MPLWEGRSQPAPTRYRTTDWSSYDAALCRRGSLLVWLDRETKWPASPCGRPGRPEAFCDVAIQFRLSIKVLFGLALRQTIGMGASLRRMAGPNRPVPDDSTLCRAGWGGTAVIPIRKNGRPWREDGPAARARNETLRASRHFGRAFRERLTGYHARSRIEAQMLRLKTFGERIASRDPDRQAAEIRTRIALLSRFSALGRAEVVRVA